MANAINAIAAGLSAIMLTAASASAELVSYRYDGVYVGATTATAFSDASCPTLPLNRIEIKNGILRAWNGNHQSVKGFITHDGFFNADYYFLGEHGVVFEGIVDAGGRLTGGIFRADCAWVVDLTKMQ